MRLQDEIALQPFLRRLHDGIRRNAEMLVQFLVRRAFAKAGHAAEHALFAQPAVPAEADQGFHADAQLT